MLFRSGAPAAQSDFFQDEKQHPFPRSSGPEKRQDALTLMEAGLLASGSARRLRLPIRKRLDSGRHFYALESRSPVTAAAPRRICPVFPIKRFPTHLPSSKKVYNADKINPCKKHRRSVAHAFQPLLQVLTVSRLLSFLVILGLFLDHDVENDLVGLNHALARQGGKMKDA